MFTPSTCSLRQPASGSVEDEVHLNKHRGWRESRTLKEGRLLFAKPDLASGPAKAHTASAIIDLAHTTEPYTWPIITLNSNAVHVKLIKNQPSNIEPL